MLRRALLLAVAGAALASGGAQARVAVDTSPRFTFTAPGSYTAAVKTPGALIVMLFNPGPADGCHGLTVDVKVDGGEARTLGVPAGAGSSPVIAPVRRGERKIEVQARFTRPCSGTVQATLSLTIGEDKLTAAQLGYVDRTNTLKRFVQPAAVSLASRRIAVDQALEKVGRDTYRAVERKHEATADLIEIGRAQAMLRRRLAALGRTPRLRMTPAASDALAAIRSVSAELARVEAQAVSAARAGRGLGDLNRRIGSLRGQVLSLELRVDGMRPDVVRDQWRAVHREQHRLAVRYHELAVAQADAEHEREVGESTIARLLQARVPLDREAFDLAAHLASLDVDVRDVRVTANGRLVFHFQGQRTQFEQLAKLNAEIDEAKEALDALERVRRRAAETFYENQRLLIAAEAHLAATIWRAARVRALIDGLFHVWDLANAFAKGGPIAAALQATSKLIEAQIQERLQPGGRAPAPDSIEAEIARRYGVQLNETITQERMGYLVTERLARDSVGKAGRDALGGWLANNLWEKVGAPSTSPPRFSERFVAPTPARVAKWLRAERSFGHMNEQVKQLQKGFRVNRGLVGNFSANVLKDLGKTFLKRAVDEVEAQAWRDFFERDVIARASYPVYKLAKDLEWEAYEGHLALEQRRQALVDAGWDLRGYRTPVSEAFDPDAQLEVTVQAVGLGAGDPPFAVTIGRTAVPFVSRSGQTLIYRVSASQLEAGTQSTITIG